MDGAVVVGENGAAIYFKRLVREPIAEIAMVMDTTQEVVIHERDRKEMVQAQANKLLANKLQANKLQANDLLANDHLANELEANDLLANRLLANDHLANDLLANKDMVVVELILCIRIYEDRFRTCLHFFTVLHYLFTSFKYYIVHLY